ncbi:MAG: secretion protein HlyD family protein, partial [Francisellaceae bacterium]|nr:secretion protein HlyD family protein [Francisellaceae bacterium]
GQITNFSLVSGTQVQTGQALFALIKQEGFWVDVNFKETELINIKPGQTANIQFDIYPKLTFKGKVESISGGTGTVFSLLPPQNATGNWVKVTQRVPVKVLIVNKEKELVLPVGISASVRVNLKDFSP